jgi:hypothetical protein
MVKPMPRPSSLVEKSGSKMRPPRLKMRQLIAAIDEFAAKSVTG